MAASILKNIQRRRKLRPLLRIMSLISLVLLVLLGYQIYQMVHKTLPPETADRAALPILALILGWAFFLFMQLFILFQVLRKNPKDRLLETLIQERLQAYKDLKQLNPSQRNPTHETD